MRRPLLTAVAVLLALGGLVLITLVVTRGANEVLPPLPDPNGYQDFKRAGGLIPEGSGPIRQMDQTALRQLVATNREALQALRQGLQKKSRVPVEFTPEWSGDRMGELAHRKGLATVLAAEAVLAGREGDPDRMVGSVLDGVAFAHESARGGLIIDALVAFAAEAIAVQTLRQTNLASIPGETARRTARELARLDEGRESFDDVLRTERLWARRSFSPLNRLAGLLSWRSLQQAYDKSLLKWQGTVAGTRALILQLAARAYEVDHGRKPARAEDLVPGYIAEVPTAPQTGQPLALPLGSAAE